MCSAMSLYVSFGSERWTWQEKKKGCDSYIPKRVTNNDTRFCYCGLPKLNVDKKGCTVCTSSEMQLVKQSVATGKVITELQLYFK